MTAEYKWCAIDAEGDVGKLGLLGVAFYSDQFQVYLEDHNEIKALLLEHAEQQYTFIAHNAEYDLSVIFWQLDIPMNAVYYNDRFNRGEWRYEDNKPMCQMWDTLSLSGNLPLWALGKAIGLPKLDTPQRLKGIDPDKYNWKCELHEIWECEACYAIRDSEIIYRFMTGLTDTLSSWGVEPQRRLAGLAEKTWRALDRPDDIKIAKPGKRSFARQAYHGGRTECFKYGTINPCYTADVSSMYPAVMLSTMFPDPKRLTQVENPANDFWLTNGEGVADVTIHVPPMHVPPLAYVHDQANTSIVDDRLENGDITDKTFRGDLLFPVGTFRGTWTILEIRYALSIGCSIQHCHKVLFTSSLIQPFTQFINILWRMREIYQETNDPRQLFAKLLMNNLYGRLGMRENLVRKDIYLAEPGTMIDTDKVASWFTEDGNLYITTEKKQPHRDTWSNVMWAAYITAAARIKLHQYMVLQGNNLLYCDTDSIFSSAPIIGIGSGLGALRTDGDYQSAIIAAPKLYAVQSFDGEWHAKAKGVRRDLALQYLHGEVVKFSRPIKPKGQMRSAKLAGTWIDVTRTKRYNPSRRQILNPASLELDYGYSDTSAPVVLLSP